jgi:hypothetical protein
MPGTATLPTVPALDPATEFTATARLLGRLAEAARTQFVAHQSTT